jgi:hypothetical protein
MTATATSKTAAQLVVGDRLAVDGAGVWTVSAIRVDVLGRRWVNATQPNAHGLVNSLDVYKPRQRVTLA